MALNPNMKQLVSIFRAEGKLAADLRRLCINTAPDDMLTLRESLREQALSAPHPTAFIEFLDDWSMGDDFKRVLGAGTRTRYVPMGVVYIRSVTPLMRSSLQQQMKRRQQFPEQEYVL